MGMYKLAKNSNTTTTNNLLHVHARVPIFNNTYIFQVLQVSRVNSLSKRTELR
jgi:hypothetical protein